MLSSVLSSPRAIAINIEIMRTFVRVRELANTHGDLAKRLGELEEKTEMLALQQDNFGLFVVFIRWTSGLLKQAPGHWHRGTMAYPGC